MKNVFKLLILSILISACSKKADLKERKELKDAISISDKDDFVVNIGSGYTFVGFSMGPNNDVWIAVKGKDNTVVLKKIQETVLPPSDEIFIKQE